MDFFVLSIAERIVRNDIIVPGLFEQFRINSKAKLSEFPWTSIKFKQ